MVKRITSGRIATPESVLIRQHPRCVRRGCPNRVFAPLDHMDMCAEHLLEVYTQVSDRVTRAAVPGLPLGLGAMVLPDPAPVVTEGVYYVDFGEYVKIGFTTNIEQRMQTFRNSHPSPQLLAMERGGRALEKARHREFAEYHVEREMFKHGKRIFDHIKAIGGRVA